jgi:hypothetical protein
LGISDDQRQKPVFAASGLFGMPFAADNPDYPDVYHLFFVSAQLHQIPIPCLNIFLRSYASMQQ